MNKGISTWLRGASAALCACACIDSIAQPETGEPARFEVIEMWAEGAKRPDLGVRDNSTGEAIRLENRSPQEIQRLSDVVISKADNRLSFRVDGKRYALAIRKDAPKRGRTIKDSQASLKTPEMLDDSSEANLATQNRLLELSAREVLLERERSERSD